MRLTRYEIRKRLDARSDPCALFELINRVQAPTDFQFSLSTPKGIREIRVTTTPPSRLTPDPDEILDGRIPELFDSSSWDVRLGVSRHTLDSAYQEIAQARDDSTPVVWQELENASNDYEIKLNGFLEKYGPDGIPPALGKKETVQENVYERTWIGGLKHLRSNATLRWQNLGLRIEASTTDRRVKLDELGMSEVVKVGSGPLTIYLTVACTPAAGDSKSIRIADQGATSSRNWLAPLTDELETMGFTSWICEVDCPELVIGSDLVKSISDDRKSDIEKIANELGSHAVVTGAARQLGQEVLEQARLQLEYRQATARASDQVHYESRLLMNVPASENGTVALFHILEGHGGLPFVYYQTRSWTSQSGLDVIADFRLALGELTEEFAPVEFEYVFDNYIAHGHEPEHTKLIVCWSVGDANKRHDGLTHHILGAPWLWTYRDQRGIVVPVAEIRKFPGVVIVPSG